MTELFSKDRANRCFAKKVVVFFAGGTGHPYFTTDTTAVLRAVEMEADIILLAKSVDGVYDSDPGSDPYAKKRDEISLQEILDKKLKVIDLTATTLCMENRMPLVVFSLHEENNIVRAAAGTVQGTRVIV